MLHVSYPSKKDLKDNVGKPLRYTETSHFGPEYRRDGELIVAARPFLSSVVKREFFATVIMENGLIKSVK